MGKDSKDIGTLPKLPVKDDQNGSNEIPIAARSKGLVVDVSYVKSPTHIL
jgi:hypothetical protein